MADSEDKRGCGRVFLGAMVGIAIIAVIVVVSFVTERDKEPSATKSNDSLTSHYAEVATIPGIAAVDLYSNLTYRGFSLDKSLSSEIKSWTCTQKNASNMYEASIFGPGSTEITKISASVLNYSTSDTGSMAAEFLGFIATLPYDGASPVQARQWVESNINRNISTVIGGVRFKIFSNKEGSKTRILEMTVD